MWAVNIDRALADNTRPILPDDCQLSQLSAENTRAWQYLN